MSCSRLSTILRGKPLAHSPIRVQTFSPRSTNMATSTFGQFAPMKVGSQFHTTRQLRNNQTENNEANKTAAQQEAKPENNNNTTQQQQEAETPKEDVIKNLEIQIDELKNKLIYSLAERENIRTRAKKDVENSKQFGIQSFAKELLNAADNLSRCISGVKQEELESNPLLKTLWEGVSMTEAELQKAFKAHGLERFDPIGLKFDPNTMNSLAYFSDPSKEGGSVAAVMKVGYTLSGRLIRPADVAVVKPEPVANNNGENKQ